MLLSCHQCHRHIRETLCPFCGAENHSTRVRLQKPTAVQVRYKRRAALIGFVAAAGIAPGRAAAVIPIGNSDVITDASAASEAASASDVPPNHDAAAEDSSPRPRLLLSGGTRGLLLRTHFRGLRHSAMWGSITAPHVRTRARRPSAEHQHDRERDSSRPSASL